MAKLGIPSFSLRRSCEAFVVLGAALAPLPLAAGGTPAAVDSRCANTVTSDENHPTPVGPLAFFFPGLATDLGFEAPGTFTEFGNGTAALSGVIASASNPAMRFAVSLEMSGRVNPGDANYPPAGSPKLDLLPTAYVAGGGAIDPNTWHYYPNWSGTLLGLSDFAGAKIALARFGPSFQIGTGANGLNDAYGGSGWITATVLQQPSSGPALPSTFGGDGSFEFGNSCDVCADEAPADAFGNNGGHAFWLPAIGSDFVFDSPGQFHEGADGTARLTGTVARKSDPCKRFLVDVQFTGRINPGDASFPPSGSPKKELSGAAYVENGGPVDAAAWHYYLTTQGTLTGLGCYQGALLSLSRMGPAFQVGFGASGKSLRPGASGWLDVKVLKQPDQGPKLPTDSTGDINIDLRSDCDQCVRLAEQDSLGQYQGHHAITLGGIAGDLVFPDPGQFAELTGGTAKLSGIAVSASNPNVRFSVAVDLGGLIGPGDASYPPAGSPKLELKSSAYADHGGPIDPEGWRYYASLNGVLHGLGSMQGAVIEIARTGPAFQVGFGANGKNGNFGGSGWLTVTVKKQPDAGASLPSKTDGDINVDFGDCPEEGPKMTVTSFGLGCPGTGGLVPKLSLSGNFVPAGAVALSIEKGAPGRPAFVLTGLAQANLPLGPGCALLIAPVLPLAIGPIPLAGLGAGPAAGTAALQFTLPYTLTPGALTMQAFIDDKNGTTKFSATNGLRIAID